MALNWTTYYAMPHLPDYAAASAHEVAVKPIRGDAEGRKPLGRRDQKWRRVKRTDDGSIIIYDDWGAPDRWYIRFTPDNELHLYDVCWGQKATHNEIIQRVTGITTFTEAHRMWAHTAGSTVPISAPPRLKWVWDEKTKQNIYMKNGEDPEPSIFVKNERGQWVCKNPERATTHRVSRKGAKAVRARYAAGISYIKALTQLRRDDAPKHEEVVAAFRDTLLKDVPDPDLKYYWSVGQVIPPVSERRFTHGHAAVLAGLIASDDPGDQYKAFLWLQRDGLDSVHRHVDRVLMMRHPDEWFAEIEHEPGVKAIDRYKWAFPAQTQAA